MRPVVNFANYYYQQKASERGFESVRYRIISTLEDYKKTKQIQLSFKDNPGDLLAPVSIEHIKGETDIISSMHPVDVNSINDLYYLNQDEIIEINIENDHILALKKDGSLQHYDISQYFDPKSVASTRLSYMVGYMQAEKFLKDAYSSQYDEKDCYKIIADNISTLEIQDINSEQRFLKKPLDILHSKEYKKFSKDDICRIGFICGQMTTL